MEPEKENSGIVDWTEDELIDKINQIARRHGCLSPKDLQQYIKNLKDVDCLEDQSLWEAEGLFHLLGEKC